ncbi:MAG: glycosyltransferase family 61 protein [Thermosynechococcaceae cyanobacterium MS004]|nr:glycosyltransferase family 61 protein [Thermosynechococcaceae cyanobacterium MS004]
MKYFLQKQTKEIVKEILSTTTSLFCIPLTREDTRNQDFLEGIFKTNNFEISSLSINGTRKELPVKVDYYDSTLFRIRNPKNRSLKILPSGGICIDKKILCTGFKGQQFFNMLGYLLSYIKRKKFISGTIICNWPQQFLTYGDFVLQLLPELCLIKSLIFQEEWENAKFIFHKPPKFLINYLKILGCDERQIIDSRDYCFTVEGESQIYFREKDKMWFLCAPLELLEISRKYLIDKQDKTGEKILFVERIGGYRRAIGLDESIRGQLREIGVSFFDPTNVPIKEQIQTFANAQIVIGIHGAGMANILWCREGTKVVEIFHPKFAAWCYAILANQLEMDYYSSGRDPGSMDINFREADVEVNWDDLIELIKKLKISIS